MVNNGNESPLCLDGMKARADSGGMRERNILVRSFLKSVLPKTAIHSQCSLASEATGNHKKVGRILICFSRSRIKTDGYLADPGYRQCAVESFHI